MNSEKRRMIRRSAGIVEEVAALMVVVLAVLGIIVGIPHPEVLPVVIRLVFLAAIVVVAARIVVLVTKEK